MFDQPSENPSISSDQAFSIMAIVACPKQLESFRDMPVEEILIVSPDFLTIEMARKLGMAAANPDSIIAEMDSQLAYDQTAEIRLRACDWFFDDDVDITMFLGSSLGRKSLIHSLHALATYNYLVKSISTLIERHRPDKIFINELNLTPLQNSGGKNAPIIQDIAESYGIAYEHVKSLQPDRKGGRVSLNFSSSLKSLLQNIVRFSFNIVYGTLVVLSRVLAPFRNNKSRVLLLTTHLNALPLLERCNELPFRPVLLKNIFPNRRKLLWVLKKILQGVEIVSMPDAELGTQDCEKIRIIKTSLSDLWSSGRCKVPNELIRFAREEILDAGIFEKHAKLSKSVNSFLRHVKIDAILSDSLSNSLSCTFFEQARLNGIPSAVTWHAQMIHDIQSYVLGSDHRTDPIADMMFSWGTGQDLWLKRTNSRIRSVVTGTIVHNKPAKQHQPQKLKNILLLEHNTSPTDVSFRLADSVMLFVDTVKMLTSLGYAVKFRLHPSSIYFDTYKALADLYQLKCDISFGNSYYKDLCWADAVVGPIATGALLEALLTGVPYYPIGLEPHAVWHGYYYDLAVYDKFSSIPNALNSPYCWPDQYIKAWSSKGVIDDPLMSISDALLLMIKDKDSVSPTRLGIE